MLLSPQITGRRGPQRSGEYRLRRGAVSDGLVASYTFDDGAGTTLHDRRGYWPRGEMSQAVNGAIGYSDTTLTVLPTVDGYVTGGQVAVYGRYNGNGTGSSTIDASLYDAADNLVAVLANGTYGPTITGYPQNFDLLLDLPQGLPDGHYRIDFSITAGGSPWLEEGSFNYDPEYVHVDQRVVTPPLDGTLTGFTSDYSILVSGGGFSNTVFSPSGTEYGKTKYLSSDGNYKVSYWYMMEPEMDGAWYLWGINATDPWMDGYDSYKSGTGDAWGGTWSNSYSVAQGDLQPGPWFADGLEFSGGYIDFGEVSDAVQPGTGDFTLLFEWTNQGTGTTALFNWSTPWPPAPRIALWGTPGSDLYLSIDNPSGVEVQATFTNSAALWATLNTPRKIGVKFVRAGYAKLFIDGKFISQIDISSITGDLSGMSLCRLGAEWNPAGHWRPQGRFRRFEYHKRALTDREAAAWTGNPWRVFQQPQLPLMAFTDGAPPVTYSGYYYRYLTSLWSEG